MSSSVFLYYATNLKKQTKPATKLSTQ